jgi:hypothetical protein
MYGSKRGGWRTRPIRYCALPLPTQWSQKGAHLLLQTRTKVLDGDLEGVFRGWYPQFRSQLTSPPAC